METPIVKNDRTELQRMCAGEMYNYKDPELLAARIHARSLTRQYNLSLETAAEERSDILVNLFGSVGTSVDIETPFQCDYGFNIFLGNNVYMNFDCKLLDICSITIGDNTFIGPSVLICTPQHPTDPATRLLGEFGLPIKIGSNVWLSAGVIVCPGVTIGDGTTIGAGSVVVKDIPANCVAVGNPCRVIKYVKPIAKV